MRVVEERYAQAVIGAPFGRIAIETRGGCLERLRLCGEELALRAPEDDLIRRVATQLQAYFDQPTTPFSILLELHGTPFQQRVWQALRAIPCGTVRSYGELARALGTSARAVGGACRANPVPIVVPCHRVVAARGLGGFAGCVDGPELARKRWLLAHEGFGRAEDVAQP